MGGEAAGGTGGGGMDGVKGAVSVWDGAAALSWQPGGGDGVVPPSTALRPSLAHGGHVAIG